MNTPYEKKKPVIKAKGKKETKVIYVRKIEKRDDFIKKFGQKEFQRLCQKDEKWAELQDIPVPKMFRWLFKQFLSIRQNCEWDFNGNMIFTPRVILDYMECLGIDFTYRERQTLLAMHQWAEETVRQVRKKSEEE